MTALDSYETMINEFQDMIFKMKELGLSDNTIASYVHEISPDVRYLKTLPLTDQQKGAFMRYLKKSFVERYPKKLVYIPEEDKYTYAFVRKSVPIDVLFEDVQHVLNHLHLEE